MQFVLFLAKYFRRHTVDLLEYLVEIGDGAKTHIVTDGRNGVVCMLQLESCLLQADLIQVLGHGITGVLPELSAQIGLAEMKCGTMWTSVSSKHRKHKERQCGISG